MTSKPSGKENVGAASTRFGFTHSTKGKTKGASTATVASKNPSVTVPLQEKDGPSADTDPYNLKKMAEEAMPDVTEQYNEIRKKLRAANKVKDIKQKCARIVHQARLVFASSGFGRFIARRVRMLAGW